MSDELFVGKTKIEIELFYVVDKNKAGGSNIRVLEDAEARKLLADEKTKAKVKSIRTEWKQPGWESQNQVIAQANVYNHFKNDNEIDPFKYRDARLKTYLVGWNIKDDAGNDVPLTNDAINLLQPSICFSLLDKFDELTSVNKEEQAKN